jgi:poly-gamma-glutamate capsule biosynthesis protein CapA/YwtB (metallophosphatase superfamily)
MTRDGQSQQLLMAVGDIAPDRADPNECFALIRSELARADLVFCQLETVLSGAGTRLPQARHAVRGKPQVAEALRGANFGVVSLAGNHCMDFGSEALLESIAYLQTQGLSCVGTGANIAQARRPVVRTLGASRIAFLAYCSILPMAYWADERRAGCVPMRAWTHYEQIEHDQPGTPCRVHTFAHQQDLAALRHDVQQARAQADVVIVSIHWGIHFVPAVIADYQREVGHAAVEAGADLILGHHAHILKGIEVYRGRAILYSLGNFAIDLRMDQAHAQSKSFREIQSLNPKWIPNVDSLYNFPEDSRKTIIVQAAVSDRGLGPVSVLPCYINDQAQPRLLRSSPCGCADSSRAGWWWRALSRFHARSAKSRCPPAAVRSSGRVRAASESAPRVCLLPPHRS